MSETMLAVAGSPTLGGTEVVLDTASVVESFERRVGGWSRRCAIRAGAWGPALSYGELERHANAVAALLLRRRGDAPEPVPLSIASPAHMLAAALGTLKAGKFYVPVNPFHPRQRVRALLDELAAPLLLCDEAGARVAGTPGVVSVEETFEDTTAHRPGLRFEADRVAYVIYTSGSTSRPRGVAVRRGDMLHNIGRHNTLGVGQADRVTLLSADGFVTSVSNPYLTLLRGGTLAPYSFRDSGVEAMIDWLSSSGITVFYGFPSFLRQLAAATPPGREHRGLRLAYLGGETVLPSDLAAARRLFPEARLATGLNSTETGLTCLHVVQPGAPVPDPVPVGQPVAGVEVAVMEDGEIEIRSRYVRPRYWRQDGFDDPTRELEPGRYAFRTGDRGRVGERGEIYHLGRLDGAVKIRGFRVEVTEVEAAVAALDGVTDVAVVVSGEEPSAAELTAYVVGTDLTPATVRGGVAAVLPAAMIPARVVVLDALPRLANGKVDRRALAGPAGPPAPTAPAPGVPKRIAAIWRSVLGVDEVAPGDDFFALGGTSISAVTTIARVREEFGVQVPLAALFETPTVEELAAAVVRLRPAPVPAAVEVRFARATDWPEAAALAGEDPDVWLAERSRFHARYPWLVAELDGEVAGFACARPWRDGAGYATTAEVSIHAAPGTRGGGVNEALCVRLLELLDVQGYRTAVATIALPSDAAVDLHESAGFRLAGTLPGVAGDGVQLWLREAPAASGPIRAVPGAVE